MRFKIAIDSFLRSLGLVVRRASLHNDATTRRKHLLSACKVDCVFDVGAYIGDYAIELRRLGYSGHIVSFEPLPEQFAKLNQRACKDLLWTVGPRCALGRMQEQLRCMYHGI